MADTTVTVKQTQPGTYEISGRSKSDPSSQIDFYLLGIKAPGKYPLGTYSSLSGGYVQISGTQGEAFVSPTSGSAGEVEITSLSATRIVGKFNLTAVGSIGGTMLAVSNGVFDLPVPPSNVGPVLDSVGGFFRGTVDGQTYSPAGALAYLPDARAGRMSLYAYNNAPNESSTEILILLENITTTGTFTLDVTALRYMSVKQTVYRSSTRLPVGSWHSQNAGSTGTVTITALTASRIAGTLTSILAPAFDSPIARPINVTAQFDLGRRNNVPAIINANAFTRR